MIVRVQSFIQKSCLLTWFFAISFSAMAEGPVILDKDSIGDEADALLACQQECLDAYGDLIQTCREGRDLNREFASQFSNPEVRKEGFAAALALYSACMEDAQDSLALCMAACEE